MRPEDRIRLEHMLDAAQTAQSFLTGRVRSDLDSDRQLLFAVVRAVEIIGEAASRISAQTHDTLPAIPWPAVIGMRNRLVHAYFNINTETVWKTVTEELPPLVAALETALNED